MPFILSANSEGLACARHGSKHPRGQVSSPLSLLSHLYGLHIVLCPLELTLKKKKRAKQNTTGPRVKKKKKVCCKIIQRKAAYTHGNGEVTIET